MFKYIAEGFKRYHIKSMDVKDERVLAFQNLDMAKRCVLFWVADDVLPLSLNKIREALAEHMEVDMLAFIRNPKSNPERIAGVRYLESSGISYQGEFVDAEVRQMLDKEDCLFIDLSLKPDVFGNYIVTCAKATCKIGFNGQHAKHDIDFGSVQNIEDFTTRLFELLTKINTY